MAFIISFSNEKGGVGKTTNTINVAYGLQMRGYRVIAIDADPLAHLRKWHEKNNGEKLDVRIMDRESFSNDIKRVANEKTIIVIDGPPGLDKIKIQMLKVSDVIIVPVFCCPYDVWLSENVISAIREKQELTEGKPKSAFLVNRVKKGTNLARDIDVEIANSKFPVLTARISDSVAFPTSIAKGDTIFCTGESAAGSEMNTVIEEIIARFIPGDYLNVKN